VKRLRSASRRQRGERTSPWRASRPRLRLALVAGSLLFTAPDSATAQLSDPCEAACSLVLGVTGYAVATGALVAWGRHTGGISTDKEGMWAWGTGFVLTVGGGVALGGNGERQERAVYAAGLGVLAGSAVGLAVGSMRPDSNGTTRLAATLIGAGAGALIGGVYGALTHDQEGAGAPRPVPLLTFRLQH